MAFLFLVRRMNMGRERTILIVEDSEDVYDLLSDYLAQAGYQVIGASDGAEAVEIATRRLPNIVLMDLVLPRMDGFQVASALKADVRTRHIPIIALTGLVQARYTELAHQAGCAAVIA